MAFVQSYLIMCEHKGKKSKVTQNPNESLVVRVAL